MPCLPGQGIDQALRPRGAPVDALRVRQWLPRRWRGKRDAAMWRRPFCCFSGERRGLCRGGADTTVHYNIMYNRPGGKVSPGGFAAGGLLRKAAIGRRDSAAGKQAAESQHPGEIRGDLQQAQAFPEGGLDGGNDGLSQL